MFDYLYYFMLLTPFIFCLWDSSDKNNSVSFSIFWGSQQILLVTIQTTHRTDVPENYFGPTRYRSIGPNQNGELR